MALGIIQALDSADAVDDTDRVFMDIHDTANQLKSIARSIREDAYRRNGAWLRIHRAEFIQQTRLLVGLIRDVAPFEGERARR